jgi:hypothetical protein
MRREKTQISKIRNKKKGDNNINQGNPESSETTLRTYILINWKILKKWMKFQVLMTISN